MLKKLRLKFILVNMTIVTVMLILILGLLYVSTRQNLEQESMQMLGTVSMNPVRNTPPDRQGDGIRLPYFYILETNDGETTAVGGDFFDLSDEELLQTLLQMTADAGTESGILEEYNLRFLRSQTPKGVCVVFADITSEQATLRNLMKTGVLIGIAAFLVFLCISILLAYWAVKPVEQAWLQQKQFVADASHELKTPLTVIMTDAELLHSPDCPEADRSQLSGSIIAMSRQMRGLVESLLELARMDSPGRKEERVKVSLSETASTAAMMFEPVFFEKDHLFQSEIAPDITVEGSPQRLKQLLDILLDNAGKYASPGGQIQLRLTRSGHSRCLIEVADQGEPLSREELSNIFKRFYRGDKVRSMNHSYGLGLSIAEGIAHQHRGRIWAESSGGYNRFFVELPALPA